MDAPSGFCFDASLCLLPPQDHSGCQASLRVSISDQRRLIVTVIREGGARSIGASGQRRVLTWKAWVLHHAYTTAASGHVGAHGVESKIRTVGWWSNLHKDREAWVSRCITRCAVKGHTLGTSTWRSERHTAPFRMTQMDLITDLAPASEEKQHILPAIDLLFTLWKWLAAIPDKKAITVATALAALFHGVYLDLAVFPVILRSDNGKEFVAEVTRELNNMLGTTQILGSAYQPRSPALVERSRKPTEAMRQSFVHDYPQIWAAKPPIAGWAWNTSPEKAERHDLISSRNWAHATEPDHVHDQGRRREGGNHMGTSRTWSRPCTTSTRTS